jgi:hypothetical protein
MTDVALPRVRSPFIIGERVRHEEFGPGAVLTNEGQLHDHVVEVVFVGRGVQRVSAHELHHVHWQWVDDD